MKDHLAISQLPLGTETQPEHFAQRKLLMDLNGPTLRNLTNLR
jgi:hypothetical protein